MVHGDVIRCPLNFRAPEKKFICNHLNTEIIIVGNNTIYKLQCPGVFCASGSLLKLLVEASPFGRVFQAHRVPGGSRSEDSGLVHLAAVVN